MKKRNNKKAALYIIGGVATLVTLGAVGYVCYHKPDVVKNPCRRTFFRSDGVAKKCFDTAAKANLQTLKQLILHGEVCNSYEANGKYYTGHSKDALIKSINPFKVIKKTA